MNPVSIVIVTFNRLEYTKECLNALGEIDAGYPFIITIVDNGSDDGTINYLKEHIFNKFKHMKRIFLDENKGIPYAYNTGWFYGPKDYYLKIDNDMVIRREGWLAKLVEAADTIKQGGVFAYNVEQISYHLENVDGLLVRPKPRGNLGGACHLIPERIFKEFGYWYQPKPQLYGEEDAEYSLRVRAKGYSCIYMEDERAFTHLPGGRADLPGEEKMYRAFKDNERAKNLMQGSEYHKRLIELNKGENLYVDFKP